MVRLTLFLQDIKRRPRTFIDKLRLFVRGGTGGQGLPKFGGKGGRGGHVYAVAKDNVTLKQVRSSFPTRRFTAGPGKHSTKRALLGEPGLNIQIDVPVGVVVQNDNGKVLGELNEAGEKVLLAKGGEGGDHTNDFRGQKSLGYSVTLDLKLIADVGLVGFPNAGKSTLLGAISRAAPKIAAYPFTTIQPQLGTMVYQDFRRVTVADLPGLIEGAHANVGMGHNFLKHVERTSMLLFLVDIHGFRLTPQHTMRSPLETLLLLMRELELYKEELVSKPAVLALNKIDIEGSDRILDELKDQLTDIKGAASQLAPEFRPKHIIAFDDILHISAKEQTSTDTLKARIRELLDEYADMEYEKQQGDEYSDVIKSRLSERLPGTPLV